MSEQFTPSAGGESQEYKISGEMSDIEEKFWEQMLENNEKQLRDILSARFDGDSEKIEGRIAEIRAYRESSSIPEVSNPSSRKNSTENEKLDILMNLGGLLSDSLADLMEENRLYLEKLSLIEEVAPGITDKIFEIRNDLELALQLEEDSPQLEAIRSYFVKSEGFPADTVLTAIKKGGGKPAVQQAVRDYIDDINSTLKIANIQALDTEGLE